MLNDGEGGRRVIRDAHAVMSCLFTCLIYDCAICGIVVEEFRTIYRIGHPKMYKRICHKLRTVCTRVDFDFNYERYLRIVWLFVYNLIPLSMLRNKHLKIA